MVGVRQGVMKEVRSDAGGEGDEVRGGGGGRVMEMEEVRGMEEV